MAGAIFRDVGRWRLTSVALRNVNDVSCVATAHECRSSIAFCIPLVAECTVGDVSCVPRIILAFDFLWQVQ